MSCQCKVYSAVTTQQIPFVSLGDCSPDSLLTMQSFSRLSSRWGTRLLANGGRRQRADTGASNLSPHSHQSAGSCVSLGVTLHIHMASLRMCCCGLCWRCPKFLSGCICSVVLFKLVPDLVFLHSASLPLCCFFFDVFFISWTACYSSSLFVLRR